MIDLISGMLVRIGINYVIIDICGLGLKVQVTQPCLHQIEHKLGLVITLNTVLIIKENSIDMFGFLEESELAVFNNLNKVSGIGPKTSINILNKFGAKQVVSIICSQDAHTLSTAQGIGIKTAKKVVIELEKPFSQFNSNDIPSNQAIIAIQNMGHNLSESISLVEAAKKNLKKGYSTQDLVKEALKTLI